MWYVHLKAGEEQSVLLRVLGIRLGCLLGKGVLFSQQQSRKLHGEMWASLLNQQGPKIFREVEIVPDPWREHFKNHKIACMFLREFRVFLIRKP